MVEGWKGELTKLREKVVMARKNLFSKGKEGSEEEQVVKKEAHKVMMAVQRDTHETMSEATVMPTKGEGEWQRGVTKLDIKE
ncbi:hypothetical protein JHK87_054939 [Glycine soja]|nr:hypothetical protein JHK87_054939 [Glycine soja]